MSAPRNRIPELVDLTTLVESENNPNVMSPESFTGLREAIRHHADLQPLLVWERADGSRKIVDGHHRRRAMLELGYTTGYAVVLPPETPPETIELLQLGMNRLRGQIDLSAAETILRELVNEGIPPDLLVTSGFTEAEIDELLNPEDDKPRSADRPADDQGSAVKIHVLELRFDSAATLKRVKAKLKKMSKLKDLPLALLRVLDLEETS